VRGRGWPVKAGILAAAVALVSAAAIAAAEVVQQGKLRITVLAQIQPYKLPRQGVAPIAVFIAGHVDTRDGTVPAQLERMVIKVNRRGLLQSQGLATCTKAEINPGSSRRALSNCADALVGSGRFWATIVLPDQRPYPTRGRLLIFNGMKGGRHVLFAHIYTRLPFSTSFVITFEIDRIAKGRYGTELSAYLPQALGSWGFVDRIKLTLRRKYAYRGRPRSYFNAGCPAPGGTRIIAFPLAYASFYFADQKPLGLSVTKSCRVAD
jgi:hypothetical protein